MIVEVIHNSKGNKNKTKRKRNKNLAAPHSMHDEILGYPPHPALPTPLQQLSPQRPPGRKLIRVSEAMSALKIPKAVNENLRALTASLLSGLTGRKRKTKQV